MSTASTSALSAVLSALNNGNSGINVTAAVASIISADSAPVTAWQAQQSTLSTEASSIQQLESEAGSVTDALQTLSDVGGVFSSTTATSSNNAVLTATTSSGASLGTHTVQVNSLAATAAWYSAAESSSTAALPSGSFSIAAGGTTKTFTTGSGVDTLSELASAINTASLGVTANVVTDDSGARLSLVSQNPGASGDFSVSADSTIGFTRAATGADASLVVDGVPVTSASNTVSNIVPGLTLNLASTSAAPVSVSLTPATSQIEFDVSTFVTAYNTLISDLNSQFTYSSSTDSEGTLSSDSAARALQSDVLAASNLQIGSGAISTLSDLGITTNQDGTLSLNSQTLDTAVANNYQDVVNFFQGTGGSGGFASTLTSTLNNYTDPSQGAFTVDLQSLSNENQELSTDISNYETYLDQQQTLLTTEYNNANIELQQLPSKIQQTQILLGTESTSSNS